eukprot:comp22835_c0_seq1/m.35942 comp22835_c0_seq1/g.35942  ORF comp22835_c0_seq1/g.35942 comp22835_c0_seq1/m.35942 type:complete len:576 (-) comp22835_c0_seq1:484-2211(-)
MCKSSDTTTPPGAQPASLQPLQVSRGEKRDPIKDFADVEPNANQTISVASSNNVSGENSQPATGTCTTPPPSSKGLLSHVWWVLLRLEAARDWVRLCLSHPWLTQPLLGNFLTKHFMDINIIELAGCAIFVWLVMFWQGAQRHERGAGLAIITAFVLGTVPRNSVWQALLGVSFERMIKYHRWSATFSLIPILLHALAYNAFKTCTGQILPPKRPGGKPRLDTRCFWGDDFQSTGFVAMLAFFIMFLTSLPIVRRRGFELFYYTHSLFIAFIVGCWLHFPTMKWYIIPPLALYGVDRVFRLVQSRFFTGRVQSVQALPGGVTKIVVDKSTVKHLGYRGGQYAFVCFPDVSSLQWHPLSIATCPTDNAVEFYARGSGHWSRALASALQVGSKMQVEGGYGAPGTPLHLTRTVVLVAGGIGVVPMVSTIRDIVAKAGSPQQVQRVNEIVLVWAVRHAAELTWFARNLEHVRSVATDRGILLRLRYYVTGTRQESGKEINTPSEVIEEGVSLAINTGRPDVRGVLADIRATLSLLGSGHVVGVHVCGPDSLAYSTLTACTLETSRKVTFAGSRESFEL